MGLDISMNVRGEVNYTNFLGHKSPRYNEVVRGEVNDPNLLVHRSPRYNEVVRGEVSDPNLLGHRSPRYNEVVRDEVNDPNLLGHRSPRYKQTRIDDMDVFRGEVIDQYGLRSPINETDLIYQGIISQPKYTAYSVGPLVQL